MLIFRKTAVVSNPNQNSLKPFEIWIKKTQESSVFDEVHPERETFIFFFLVCAEADVFAYVFRRYPDATVKQPCA